MFTPSRFRFQAFCRHQAAARGLAQGWRAGIACGRHSPLKDRLTGPEIKALPSDTDLQDANANRVTPTGGKPRWMVPPT